ncbi:MAG: bifunctional diaminohydroxyphosphoribosylaminopyrimidine deaminase/5-amino-6-(5-phosphoribosylamino)uracil reductase RibD [Bacteroidota bacterium]
MARALDLAQLGHGSVSPNPLVGCVIVHDNEIIGEGWHQQYGQAHAEVNAINSVANQDLLKNSTAYVNLEPCSHFGKTPPCADLIVQKQLKKVVVANVDSNPKVGGKGIALMRNAGIEVITGVLEEEGRIINQRFFTYIEKARPYVILKWAETADGYIARENFDSKWISNALSRQLVHKWRAEEDAILVGTNTARYDNPKLNVRDWSGRNPIRIVIDKALKLDKNLALFDQSQHTYCYNLAKDEKQGKVTYVKLTEDNFTIEMLQHMAKQNIQSLIVEGGSQLLSSLIGSDLWDEARVFKSSARFEKGIAAPRIQDKWISSEQIQSDQLLIYKHTNL